jgi:hypothetical protein
VEKFGQELVGVIWALLPGFVAAWVYYGLTAHRKQSQFERTVQALIFTGLTLPFVLLIKLIATSFAVYLDFGTWDANVQAVWGVIVALPMGVGMSYFANNSKVHTWLSKFNVTKRTSFPSEWFSAFGMDQRYVLLHLDDGRRLYGWPYENPDHPDTGYFVLMKAEWILPDNTHAPIDTSHRILVPATKVVMVEFDKDASEYEHNLEKHEETVRLLVDLNEKEKQNVERASRNDEVETGATRSEPAPKVRAPSSASGEDGQQD